MSLNDTLHQIDIADYIQNIPSKDNRTHIFSSAHEIFFRIDHMLGHKTILNKFRKIEIILYIFSGQNNVKLEINPKGEKNLEKAQMHGS